jgi:hypothetical protein
MITEGDAGYNSHQQIPCVETEQFGVRLPVVCMAASGRSGRGHVFYIFFICSMFCLRIYKIYINMEATEGQSDEAKGSYPANQGGRVV